MAVNPANQGDSRWGRLYCGTEGRGGSVGADVDGLPRLLRQPRNDEIRDGLAGISLVGIPPVLNAINAYCTLFIANLI